MPLLPSPPPPPPPITDATTPLRHPESPPSRHRRLRVKNRRNRYLDTHPAYFSPALELANPLLYDRLIRRYQSAAEREADGRAKGYSGVLEADITRSEAKLAAIEQAVADGADQGVEAEVRYVRGSRGEVIEVPAEGSDAPQDRDDARRRWEKAMRMRFLRGQDEDFEYAAVDEAEEFDDRLTEERERQERWFEEEEPSWVEDEASGTRQPTGQTGVQDF